MVRMIYTVTPNPALDLGGTVDRLKPNEKIYVHDETRFPGGNAINAARMIHKLGFPVIAGGLLGGGVGRELRSLLIAEGIRGNFISIREDTRISVTVSDRHTHLQTRLSFSGPTIHRDEIKALFHWITKIPRNSLVLIGGSLPPGFTATHVAQIVKLLRKHETPWVIDCPGAILGKVIAKKPTLIKPNLIEFQDLVGKSVRTRTSVLKEAKHLTRWIPYVCISSIEGGALLVTPHAASFGKLPKLKVRSTVGAGDSMVGAMSALLHESMLHARAASRLNPVDSADLLRWGLAAAGATLSQPGTSLGNKTDVLRLYPRIQITQVMPL